MIRFEGVSVTYRDAAAPVLRDVTLTIPEGELCLVTGRTGAGKSTLLRLINATVPHFSGGHVGGRVTVNGLDTRTHMPRMLAGTVGMVGQDPLAGFVTDSVEDELAYSMEQLAMAPVVMRKRVEEVLDLLGLAELRRRPLRTLSGGQHQRVAIGAVLTAQPRILVLDEPTSALDPLAAEEVLAAITRLVHDLGLTVVVAEHRLERVAQYADRVLAVRPDGTVLDGTPSDVFAVAEVAPPVVRLGRLAEWSPLPMSVRDARRHAGDLRTQLQHRLPPEPIVGGTALLTARGVRVRYGSTVAVRDCDIAVLAGQVTALMGRNGSGKSSLLWALQGSGPRQAGTVSVGGHDPGRLTSAEARRHVGLVPQTASDLLYLPSVNAECAQADREADSAAGSCRRLLDGLVAEIDGELHPRDLSEGQRLALVLAIQLNATPKVILLDEPTRGLDYGVKMRFGTVLTRLAAEGHAVVVATHDVEFVAEVAARVVVMADGDIVADGPTVDIVTASPIFAPQVAKVLAPQRWLTVEQVGDALGITAKVWA